MPTEDAIIKHWANQVGRVYTERTAGGYTFSGMLSEFLRQIDDARHERIIKG